MRGSRVANGMTLIGIVLGLSLLIAPHWMLDVLFRGRAAPAAYEAFTYTETFRQRQAPFLLALILVHVPMLITGIVNVRWSTIRRRPGGAAAAPPLLLSRVAPRMLRRSAPAPVASDRVGAVPVLRASQEVAMGSLGLGRA